MPREQLQWNRKQEVKAAMLYDLKCGQLVQQKEKTMALLRFCIYPKAIFWGKENEEKAYEKYMGNHGHQSFT